MGRGEPEATYAHGIAGTRQRADASGNPKRAARAKRALYRERLGEGLLPVGKSGGRHVAEGVSVGADRYLRVSALRPRLTIDIEIERCWVRAVGPLWVTRMA